MQSKDIEVRKAGGLEDFNGTPSFTFIYESSGEIADEKKIITTKDQRIDYYFKGKDGIYLIGNKESLSDNMSYVTFGNDPPCLEFPYVLSIGKQWTNRYIPNEKVNVDRTEDYSWEMVKAQAEKFTNEKREGQAERIKK